MHRVRRYQNILLNYPSFNKQEKQWVKSNMSLDFVKLIIEICVNVLNGNIPLDRKLKKFLEDYKSKLQVISSGQKTISEKKRIIQRGGFLPLLLSTAGSAIIQQLLSHMLDNVE